MTTTTVTPSISRGLHALGNLLTANPELRPPHIGVCALNPSEVDAWAAALTDDFAWPFTDKTDDFARKLTVGLPGLTFEVTCVHDEPMRRHHAEVKFLAQHQAEIDARLAAASCTRCSQQLHDDDTSNTGLGYHVDCTADGALAGQSA